MKNSTILAGTLLAFGTFAIQSMEEERPFNEALWEAIANKDTKIVKEYLKSGYSPNLEASDEYGNSWPMLYWAILGSNENPENLNLIEALLKAGADLNIADNQGTYRLNQAASRWPQGEQGKRGLFNTVKLLIKYGADVNVQDRTTERTPLHNAIRENHEDIAKLLIDRGARVNIQDSKGKTPLHEAIIRKNKNLVKLLLKNGADTSTSDKEGKTALEKAQEWGEQEIISLLEKETRHWNQAFFDAIMAKDAKAVEEYLKQGENPNTQTSDGWTLLRWATKNSSDDQKSLEVIEVLLKVGANPQIASNTGALPLNEAAAAGRNGERGLFNTVQLLVQYGALINAQDRNGHTPLHNAVFAVHEDIAKLLIDKGARANIQDNEGKTPLHEAVARENLALVKLLLDAGAKVTIQNKYGKTPLDIIQEKLKTQKLTSTEANAKEIEQLLIKAQPWWQKISIREMLPFAQQATKPSDTSVPAQQPQGVPQPTAPQGQPQPLVPAVGGAALQAARPQQGATLFNRKNLIIATLGTLASGGLLYTYLTTQEVPTLDKDALCDQLTQALTDKQYQYAYQLALKNPVALQALKADAVAKRDFAHRIEQAESTLINETGEPLSLYQQLAGPSISSQLKHLADLQQIIGQ